MVMSNRESQQFHLTGGLGFTSLNIETISDHLKQVSTPQMATLGCLAAKQANTCAHIDRSSLNRTALS